MFVCFFLTKQVPNLPNTYYFVRDTSKSKKRKIDELNEQHEHSEPKPVYLNHQHRIYFLEDQVPLKRYKRDYLPLQEPIDYEYASRRNAMPTLGRRGMFETTVTNSMPSFTQTLPNVAQPQVGFSPRQFFIPFSFFQTKKPEFDFNKPVVFSHDALNQIKKPLSPIQQVHGQPRFNYNDELFSKQWYLNQDSSAGSKPDLHIRDAWRMGATGKGVVVSKYSLFNKEVNFGYFLFI